MLPFIEEGNLNINLLKSQEEVIYEGVSEETSGGDRIRS